MNLKSYQAKRNFRKTIEPRGKLIRKNLSRFVVQEHQASRLHYDFRLELGGVLKSWAVPKGMPTESGIKRLAVAVEDHQLIILIFLVLFPKASTAPGRLKFGTRANGKCWTAAGSAAA